MVAAAVRSAACWQPLRQTHEANAKTTTTATPKPITAIAKGSYAGILNITNYLRNSPKLSTILVAKSFVSANIGRSRNLPIARQGAAHARYLRGFVLGML